MCHYIKIIESYFTERSMIDYSQEEYPPAKLQNVSMADALEALQNVSMTEAPEANDGKIKRKSRAYEV